jgi:hypothetical protein
MVATSCASSDTAGSGSSARFIGYSWRIVEVRHGVSHTSISPALDGYIAFAPDHTLRADDTVNFHFGKYHVDGDGFRPHAGSTLVGYAGHDPARLALIGAVDAVTQSDAVVLAVSAGNRLTLKTGDYTVLCERQGVAHNDTGAPSPTPTPLLAPTS